MKTDFDYRKFTEVPKQFQENTVQSMTGTTAIMENEDGDSTIFVQGNTFPPLMRLYTLKCGGRRYTQIQQSQCLGFQTFVITHFNTIVSVLQDWL